MAKPKITVRRKRKDHDTVLRLLNEYEHAREALADAQERHQAVREKLMIRFKIGEHQVGPFKVVKSKVDGHHVPAHTRDGYEALRITKKP